MRLTVLGHASVLVETGTDGVLVDPIFEEVYASGTLCQTPRRALDAEAVIARTTALVVTHIHLDHFHPPTLARFPRTLPIVVPAHEPLVKAVRGLGFTAVTALAPWQRLPLARGRLMATPSDYELEEFGIAVVDGADSYWHMSDAIVAPDVGARVREELGAVSLASVKYQPLRTLIAYQRGLASTMLDRNDLTTSFEAACAAAPVALFPYYSGFAFHGEHAWANRHIAPYRAGEIAALLRERLGAATAVHTVGPGDEFSIAGGDVAYARGASALVRPAPGPDVQPWEPIDPATLPGVAGLADVLWLTLESRRVLAEEVLPWVQAHLDAASGLFDCYRAFKTVWQCVIHLGADRRLHHAIDFRGPRAALFVDHEHPRANVFSHVSGGCLQRVLRREAGPEVFWMAGGYRLYEKILYVGDGAIRAPPWNGWELFERLPDPLTHYLRRGPRPDRHR
ncbi:MAG: MBL fold metallo-hydrolase [Gammaproteobacteria bacterium]|nr:MBL fold metallo-hydrolase [Gammaproteobacteria bacterium]